MFVYSPEYTCKSHLAPDYLTELNILCKRDYGKSPFKEQVICLDLDAYETSCAGTNDATMDTAVGIADYHNNQVSSSRHLLIELRLGYRTVQNFDLPNMKRKVAHSRDILCTEQINENVVFLYDTFVAPKAKSYLHRFSLQDKEIKRWIVMDVNNFNDFILDRATLPYEAENNLEDIKADLTRKYNKGGLSTLDMLVKYWIDVMLGYNLRYKYAESNAIAEVILCFLQSITTVKGSFEEEYLPLLIEDVRMFIIKKKQNKK